LWFCVDGSGLFEPLRGERIGDLRENPQYPEVGIFQRLRKVPRRWCGSTFRKEKVGTPRRRVPKFQATQSPLGDAEAALPQKWDGGGAPSLPWRTSALPRGLVR
jgi:hypothetical protein